MIASRSADRFGPPRAIGTTFALAAVSLVLLTLEPPLAVMLGLVAVAGVGGSGTQILILGCASNSCETLARGAGLAWCDGFGRLGGVLGPLAGGVLVGAGAPSLYTFYLFAGVGLLGTLVTSVASRASRQNFDSTVPEPTQRGPFGRLSPVPMPRPRKGPRENARQVRCGSGCPAWRRCSSGGIARS